MPEGKDNISTREQNKAAHGVMTDEERGMSKERHQQYQEDLRGSWSLELAEKQKEDFMRRFIHEHGKELDSFGFVEFHKDGHSAEQGFQLKITDEPVQIHDTGLDVISTEGGEINYDHSGVVGRASWTGGSILLLGRRQSYHGGNESQFLWNVAYIRPGVSMEKTEKVLAEKLHGPEPKE